MKTNKSNPLKWYQLRKKRRLRRFIAALRSGDYQQGFGELANRDVDTEEWKYCCLGVACEVAINDGLKLYVSERRYKKYYNNEGGVLPLKVRDWYGLPASDPYLTDKLDNANVHTASAFNDRYQRNFGDIADAFQHTFLPNENEENK